MNLTLAEQLEQLFPKSPETPAPEAAPVPEAAPKMEGLAIQARHGWRDCETCGFYDYAWIEILRDGAVLARAYSDGHFGEHTPEGADFDRPGAILAHLLAPLGIAVEHGRTFLVAERKRLRVAYRVREGASVLSGREMGGVERTVLLLADILGKLGEPAAFSVAEVCDRSSAYEDPDNGIDYEEGDDDEATALAREPVEPDDTEAPDEVIPRALLNRAQRRHSA